MLGLGLLSPVYADQAGVLAKVDEAAKAEGEAASTALAAADIVSAIADMEAAVTGGEK